MRTAAVLVDVDGTMSDVVVDDGRVHQFLDGPVRFVGAIDPLNVVAVARQRANAACNAHTIPEEFVEPGVRGQILLMGSDARGEAQDVRVLQLEHFLRSVAVACP